MCSEGRYQTEHLHIDKSKHSCTSDHNRLKLVLHTVARKHLDKKSAKPTRKKWNFDSDANIRTFATILEKVFDAEEKVDYEHFTKSLAHAAETATGHIWIDPSRTRHPW